jgi:hypothetical protein
MDDCFVLLAFWTKTDRNLPVPERLRSTYKSAAVSITITTLTNSISFLIGYVSPFRGARLFSLFAGNPLKAFLDF